FLPKDWAVPRAKATKQQGKRVSKRGKNDMPAAIQALRGGSAVRETTLQSADVCKRATGSNIVESTRRERPAEKRLETPEPNRSSAAGVHADRTASRATAQTQCSTLR